MAKAFLLSDADRQALVRLLADARRRQLNTQNRPHVPEEQGGAPEVYVAVPAERGIPPMTISIEEVSLVDGLYAEEGTALLTELGEPFILDGPGTADIFHYHPGQNTCNIYHLIPTNTTGTGPPDELILVDVDVVVHNFNFLTIPSTWMLVTRDKYGAWWSTYRPNDLVPFMAAITGQYVEGGDGATSGNKANAYSWAGFSNNVPGVGGYNPVDLDFARQGTLQWFSLDPTKGSVWYTAYELRGFNDYNFGQAGGSLYYPECVVMLYPQEVQSEYSGLPATLDHATGILTLTTSGFPSFLPSPGLPGLDYGSVVTITDAADPTITEDVGVLAFPSGGQIQFKVTLPFGATVNIQYTARFYLFDGQQQYRFFARITSFTAETPGAWQVLFRQVIAEQPGGFITDPHTRETSFGYRIGLLRTLTEPIGVGTGTGSGVEVLQPPAPRLNDLVEVIANLGNSGPSIPVYTINYNVNLGWSGTFQDLAGHQYEVVDGVIIRKDF